MNRSRSLAAVLSCLLSCLGLTGCFGSITARFGAGMPREIEQGGVSARAEILEIWDTRWTINDAPVIGMKVRVTPDDAPPFEATIEKTAISRLAVPQFQPGAVIAVRYLPEDPTRIAVDPNPPGEPPGFVRANAVGAAFLPPPAEPPVYLGTGDRAADALALFENDYSLIGASRLRADAGVEDALAQAKEAGAALVILYGHFAPASSGRLDVLPYRPRPAARGFRPESGGMRVFSDVGPDEPVAAFWGKIRPPVLGIVTRPLYPREQARLGRKDGILVESVSAGSPAEAARIAAGDVIVAIDGKSLPDAMAVPALLRSLAGRTVSIDLIRDGEPVTVTPRLDSGEP